MRTSGVEPGTLDFGVVHLTTKQSKRQLKEVEFFNYPYCKPKYM